MRGGICQDAIDFDFSLYRRIQSASARYVLVPLKNGSLLLQHADLMRDLSPEYRILIDKAHQRDVLGRAQTFFLDGLRHPMVDRAVRLISLFGGARRADLRHVTVVDLRNLDVRRREDIELALGRLRVASAGMLCGPYSHVSLLRA